MEAQPLQGQMADPVLAAREAYLWWGRPCLTLGEGLVRLSSWKTVYLQVLSQESQMVLRGTPWKKVEGGLQKVSER